MTTDTATGPALVDPRAPRFGQLTTMTALLVGIVLQEPVLVLAVAVVLNAALVSGWRLDLYGFLWRRVIIPVVGPPADREPAAPHRFAKLMGATFTGAATVLSVAAAGAGLPVLTLAGYGIAGLVALLAGIAGIGDYCVGCKMYRQVGEFQRLGVVYACDAGGRGRAGTQSLPPSRSAFETNWPRSSRRSATAR
jgi:hypothetical protein